MQALSIIVYLLVAVVVVYTSIKLSDYVDLLDKKTNLSGALLGGILLAAVTSLPEFFTSLTSTVFIGENALVIGNILGSNLSNIMIYGLTFIIFYKKMIEAKVSKFHLISLLFIALGYIATTIASYVFEFNQILLGWFNPASFLILIIYAISIWKTPKVEEDDGEEEDSSTLSIKQIIVRFILFAVILIGASIGITYCADWVCNEFNMAASFGGALFLGVATSLPELTSTINLCRKKNFDAAFGNLFGSCVFNFFILSIADLLSFRSIDNAHKLYYLDQSSFICLLAGAFIVLLAFISILILIKKGAKDKVGYRIFFYAVSILSVGLYIAFLVLSNIPMDIPFIV